jgi:hypothetical protein
VVETPRISLYLAQPILGSRGGVHLHNSIMVEEVERIGIREDYIQTP